MTVYGIRHTGTCKDVIITTHPHAEAARQFLAEQAKTADICTLVVVAAEDLTIPGPSLVNLMNCLHTANAAVPEVKKFDTKSNAQRRVFAALELVYKDQPQEPFNPVPTADGAKDETKAAITETAGPTEGTETMEGPMATTKKTAKKTAKKKAVKADRKPRVKAALFEDLNGTTPKADQNCGSYIRSLLMAGKLDTDGILAKVKQHYPDSSAKGSDVSWNRQKLRTEGKKVPEVAKKGA